MGEAHGVVGKFYVPEQVQTATTPDTAIAVLVGSEIFEHRDQRLAVRITGVGVTGMRWTGDPEGVVDIDVAIEHEAIVVRVGHVVAELTERRATGPGIEAVVRIQEGAVRVFGQGHPETVCIGPRSHIAYIGIIRVGDPVGRDGVVRRQQHIR